MISFMALFSSLQSNSRLPPSEAPGLQRPSDTMLPKPRAGRSVRAGSPVKRARHSPPAVDGESRAGEQVEARIAEFHAPPQRFVEPQADALRITIRSRVRRDNAHGK